MEMTTTVTIRAADDGDVEEIWRVHRSAIESTCAGHYPEAVIAAWVERLKPASYRGVVRRGVVVIAEEGETAVGFGQIDLPDGEIQAVYVSPEAQRRGIGAALLAHLESLAAARGQSRLTLKATLNAEPFYVAHGWQAVGHQVNMITQEISLCCVAMEKELPPAARAAARPSRPPHGAGRPAPSVGPRRLPA